MLTVDPFASSTILAHSFTASQNTGVSSLKKMAADTWRVRSVGEKAYSVSGKVGGGGGGGGGGGRETETRHQNHKIIRWRQ